MKESIEILGVVVICIFVFITIGFFTAMYLEKRTERKKKSTEHQFIKCTCKDVNQCSTWCQAKQLFTEDSRNGLV